jgi:hypothetical protein
MKIGCPFIIGTLDPYISRNSHVKRGTIMNELIKNALYELTRKEIMTQIKFIKLRLE